MLRHGLRLPPRLRALAAASHDGEPEHLAGVREILAGAGLDESALRNTPTSRCTRPPRSRGRRRERPGVDHPELLRQARGDARDVRRGGLGPAHVPGARPPAAGRGPGGRRGGDGRRGRARHGRRLRGAALLDDRARARARLRAARRGPAARPGFPEAEVAHAMAAFPRWWVARAATRRSRCAPCPAWSPGRGRRGVRGRAARRPCARPQGARRRVPTPAGGARRRAASSRRARRRGADGPALDALGDVPVLGAGQPVGTVRAVLDEAAADALQDRPHGPSADTARHADGVGREGRRPARDARERARRGRRRDGGGRRRDRPTGPPRARRRHARRRRRAGGDDRAQDRRAADPRGERSVLDDGAPVLVVSQFTLYADTRRADARRGTARRPVPSPSRSSTRSSTRCAPAGSRSRPDGSARTWRSTSSTTARSR